jgi:hypothetical protein
MTTPTTPTQRGDPGAIALGPGYLFVTGLATAEPVDLTTPWDQISQMWFLIGYTETGSEFNYALASGNVEVAEELDPVKISTTGRTSTLTFTMAEMTASNLTLALNGGIISVVDQPGGVWDDDIVIVEPPDLGSEQRVMFGFESEDHTERWVWRQCFQNGTMKIIRQKGTVIAGIAATFALEKPANGEKLYKAIFNRAIRGGWGVPELGGPPTITGINPNQGIIGGGEQVTITGSNFREATAVAFGGTPAASFAVATSTTITCITPVMAAPGAVDVTVTNPEGTATSTGGFTFS